MYTVTKPMVELLTMMKRTVHAVKFCSTAGTEMQSMFIYRKQN